MKIIKQCQGCGYPKANPGDNVTHGWHRSCFIKHYENVFDEEEIEEIIGQDEIPEEKIIVYLEDDEE